MPERMSCPLNIHSTLIVILLHSFRDALYSGNRFYFPASSLYLHMIMWLCFFVFLFFWFGLVLGFFGQWEVNREGSLISWWTAGNHFFPSHFFLPSWLWQLEIQSPSFYWLALRMVEHKHKRTQAPETSGKSTCVACLPFHRLPSYERKTSNLLGPRLSCLCYYQQNTIHNW